MKFLDNNGLTYLIQKIKLWLGDKVDKVDGKTLTSNDFTNTYKSNVDSNTSARHTHSNKTVLDGITSAKVTEWDNKITLADLPEQIFYWDGKSSVENSANITLFQKIYNAWLNNKKVIVIVSTVSEIGAVSSYILDSMSLFNNSTFNLFNSSGASIYNGSNSNYSYSQTDITASATIASNVVTDVGAIQISYSQGNFIATESDPIFKASAAAGITSSNITSWNNKAETSDIPTQVSSLNNDANYQTQSDVQELINNSIGEMTGIDFIIVTELPTTGIKGNIYLIANNGNNPNSYDEYIWVNNKFEKIGTTDVDLSGYVKTTDLVAITNAEIDTACA